MVANDVGVTTWFLAQSPKYLSRHERGSVHWWRFLLLLAGFAWYATLELELAPYK